jgi:dipeptidyl-peptidase 4
MKYLPGASRTLYLLGMAALFFIAVLSSTKAQIAPPKTATVAKTAKKLFTKADVLDGDFNLSPRRSVIATWSGPDTYTLSQNGDTRRVHARTGAIAPPATSAQNNSDTVQNPLAQTERAQLFIRDKNLWVTQGIKTRQLTTDGGGNILNGELDWVYEEEVYGRGRKNSYTLSPDQKYAAFLRIDEAPVKPFFINEDSGVQRVESWQYPKSGTPNPRASLGVVPIAGGTTPTFVNLSDYAEDDRLIVRYAYTPKGDALLVQVQNREQTYLDILRFNPDGSGTPQKIIHETSPVPGWVELPEIKWLSDGSFLWTSERSGYQHLYHYKTDGTLLNAITKGDFDVANIVNIAEKSGKVYFTSPGENVMESHLYVANLDGSGVTRLTKDSGTHRTQLSPPRSDGTGTIEFFLDSFSSATNPGETRVCDAKTGQVLRTLGQDKPAAIADEYALGKAQVHRFKARDGYGLEGTLLVPADFDPTKKKYAIFCPVYSGPRAPSASNTWRDVNGNLQYQFFAQHGILVWQCDNRTANPKGAKAARAQYKNFGKSELEDLEDGIGYLKKLGFVDEKRIGISGWSFGGFMTQYALTHGKEFTVGAAGAGVSDWHLYDTIYTERYMSTPQRNPEGYISSSNVKAAANLHGKLLIIHGMVDDNVHFQNSVQLAYALQKAGKPFEMMFYPGPRSRHGLGEAELRDFNERVTLEFLLKNLAPTGAK